VQDQTVGFATLLVPMSVWAAFPGLSLTFGSDGKIILPGRDYSKNVSGGFIGEGGAIPVKAGGTRAVTLTPDKVAVIIALTRELAKRSSPAALQLFQTMVLEDTAMTLDTLFLDNSAAVANIRPAGMQTLATGANTRVSSGATLQNIIADVKDMASQMGTNRMGRTPVWIMSEANRMALTLITNDLGQFMFANEIGQGRFMGYPIISSLNVPAAVVFLIDAAEIVKAQEGAPMFDVSEQATVHMDTAPSADIGSVATGLVSFWQTDQMGLRMIWELTWGERQPGAVQTLTGVAW
jgi:HK97 family phage major capsid protein